MEKIYLCTIKIDIKQKGLIYNISFSNPPSIYSENGYMGRFSSGYIYKIQDMKIIDNSSNITKLSKFANGKRFYQPAVKYLNKNTTSNNYTLDYTCKKNARAMIKGTIIVDLPNPHIITIDIYEIDSCKNETLLGTTFSDSNGNYYINFPIKINKMYKLFASYMSLY